MTLALNIIKARVNSERQLDEMTIDKAIAIYRKYGHFPPIFTHKGLKFIKHGENDNKATQAKFARVIREIDKGDDGEDYTQEFEYVNHSTKYKGVSISLETSDEHHNDAYCYVLVDDTEVSSVFRIDRPDSASRLKTELDNAIAKVDGHSSNVPAWASVPIAVLGQRIDFTVHPDTTSMTIRGSAYSASKSIRIRHDVEQDFISVSVTAQPFGYPSKRTFDFKIPVAIAESGKLASKINELCAAKKIYVRSPTIELTTISVDVGDIKHEFKVKDVAAFKKHLLQYLKGN